MADSSDEDDVPLHDPASDDDNIGSDESENEIDELHETPVVETWDEDFYPSLHPFLSSQSGIRPEFGLQDHITPFNILRKFISDDMIQEIVFESNRYADQVKRTAPKSFPKWSELDEGDIWRFFSLILSMTLVKKRSYKEYWSTDALTATPFFPTVMSRDRFKDILRAFHLVNNETVAATNKNRFIKMGSFLNRLLENFKGAVNPGKFFCIDESLIPFKGRLSFKQYNAKKRSRFGIKLFLMVDCETEFVLDILPYQGKTTAIRDPTLISTLGFGGAAVMTLLDPFLDSGHHVIIDNWFHSLILARMLKDRRTYVLGTVQKRRKGIPKTFRMMRKLKKGEVETFSDGDVLIERWMDRREVLMLNSFLSHGMTDSASSNPRNQRLKPDTVLLYNKMMGGVDNVDKMIKPNQNLRKSYKWYKKLVFYLLELAVYNAMLLYNLSHANRRLNYEAFLKEIIKGILIEFPVARKPKGRPSHKLAGTQIMDQFQHMPERVIKNDGYPSKSNCFYCKLLGKRTITQFKCSACNKRLCIDGGDNCFKKYHRDLKPRQVSSLVVQPHGSGDQPSRSEENSAHPLSQLGLFDLYLDSDIQLMEVENSDLLDV